VVGFPICLERDLGRGPWYKTRLKTTAVLILKVAARETRDAYADFAPSTVKSVQRLDGLPAAIALPWTVGFNPVMIHRLHNHPVSSRNVSDVTELLLIKYASHLSAQPVSTAGANQGTHGKSATSGSISQKQALDYESRQQLGGRAVTASLRIILARWQRRNCNNLPGTRRLE